MSTLLEYIIVFALSTLPFSEFIISIPTGIIIFNLNPIIATAVAIAGNLLSVVVFVFLGSQIRLFINRFKNPDRPPKKRNPKFKKFYDRYGVAGLSWLGSTLLSSQLTATAIVSFEDSKAAATYYVSVAVITLSIVVAVLSVVADEWLASMLNL
ncbi:hypothetical protein ACE1TF_03165 [Geomicrobium sp. JSM 1781026]|uniref:hypothetical protein n=1 Tax=Geomicrobium sp. JSM 1781026 TaxID=3344580 RepID=UPI0035C2445A